MSTAKNDANGLEPEAVCVSAQEAQPAAIQIANRPQLGVCDCGSASFSLASEMNSEAVPGIRVSRMYECTVCGSYRLQK